MLTEWQRSSESLEAFARTRKLVPQQIAWWRKRLGVGAAARPVAPSPPGFPPEPMAITEAGQPSYRG